MTTKNDMRRALKLAGAEFSQYVYKGQGYFGWHIGPAFLSASLEEAFGMIAAK